MSYKHNIIVEGLPADISDDGFYLCDRKGNRIKVHRDLDSFVGEDYYRATKKLLAEEAADGDSVTVKVLGNVLGWRAYPPGSPTLSSNWVNINGIWYRMGEPMIEKKK